MYLFIFFISLSCSSDTSETQENSLIGTWKLVEVYESNGGAQPSWKTVEDGFTYSFKENSLVTSSKFDCSGIYGIKSSQSFTIEFGCESGKMKGTLDYRFVEGNLILTPNPNTCIEGCDQKFTKVTE